MHLETDGAAALNVDTQPFLLLDTERCSGCGRCVAACREHCFTLEADGYRKTALIRFPDRCTLCGNCVRECPVKALALSSAQSGYDHEP